MDFDEVTARNIAEEHQPMKPDNIIDVEESDKAARRLTKAADQYGGREQAVLAWLLSFIQTPLDGLSEGQRIDLIWELKRFAFDGGLVYTADNMQPDTEVSSFGIDSLEVGPIDAKDLASLQRTLLEAVTEFRTRHEVTFPKVSGSFTVYGGKILYGGKSMPGFVRFGGSLEANTFFIAGQLLARYGHYVRRCAYCERLTLVGRKDKTFCSQTCQVAAWKRDHAEKVKLKQQGGAKRKRTAGKGARA